jgi:hypothetical protein
MSYRNTLIIGLASYTIADTATTGYAFSIGMHESNPFLNTIPLYSILALKILGCYLIYKIAMNTKMQSSKLKYIPLYTIYLFFLLTLTINTFRILQR